MKSFEAMFLFHRYFIDNKEYKIQKHFTERSEEGETALGDWLSDSLEAHNDIETNKTSYGTFATSVRDYMVESMRRDKLLRPASNKLNGIRILRYRLLDRAVKNGKTLRPII